MPLFFDCNFPTTLDTSYSADVMLFMIQTLLSPRLIYAIQKTMMHYEVTDLPFWKVVKF